MVSRRRVLASGLVAALSGCLSGNGGDATETAPAEETDPEAGVSAEAEPIAVTSAAFDDGDPIPARHTPEGEGGSPPLSIANVPDDAHSLAVVVDDPDAADPPFTHWLVWAILPDVRSIPPDVPKTERVEALDGAIQGTNDFGGLGYRGPMPPADDGPHRYRFAVHAVETTVDLAPGATRDELDAAMAGATLASGRLVGTYDR